MNMLKNIKDSIAETIDSMETIIYTFLFILAVVFGSATILAPVIACLKYNQTYLWFLTYLVTIPLDIFIGVFMASWDGKVK